MTHPCNIIILCTEFKFVKEEYWLWLILSFNCFLLTWFWDCLEKLEEYKKYFKFSLPPTHSFVPGSEVT